MQSPLKKFVFFRVFSLLKTCEPQDRNSAIDEDTVLFFSFDAGIFPFDVLILTLAVIDKDGQGGSAMIGIAAGRCRTDTFVAVISLLVEEHAQGIV